MSHILNIDSRPVFDNSITAVEYHSHTPYANSSFENSDEIRIPIQQQDLYTLPSESYVYIEGTLLAKKANDPTVMEPHADSKLVNNAAAFLFEEIRYELNGVEVDRCKNVGVTTTMKNYLSLSRETARPWENASWNTSGTFPHLSHGNFSFHVPLRMLMGFAEDYRKIVINARHELILLRSRTNQDAVYGTVASMNNVQLKLTKVQWKMPHISVEDIRKMELLHLLASSEMIQMSYRSWELHEYPTLPQTTDHTWSVKTTAQLEKPRYVIVCFQTDKRHKFGEQPSRFDHRQLRNLKLFLNSEIYPYDNLEVDFHKNRYGVLYEMYSKFQTSYYGRSGLPEPLLSYDEFETEGPLVVIDCSRQNESLKSATVDVRLEFQFNEAVPAKTTAYCLIIHDKIVEYNPLTNVVRKIV